MPAKLTLNVAFPLLLEKSHFPRLLLTGVHIGLAVNASLIVFTQPPLAGLFIAFILWFVARMRRTLFTKQAVNDAFWRIILSFFLIVGITYAHVLALTTNWPTKEYIWLTFLVLQMPLSLYDAKQVFHGRTVLKFHKQALWPLKS